MCGRCRLVGRQCQWPSETDMLDRRFASHVQSRHSTAVNTAIRDADEQEHQQNELAYQGQLIGAGELDPFTDPRLDLSLSSQITHTMISLELEHSITNHFVEKYFSLLLLPGCHPSFHSDWLHDIQRLMATEKSLYYSALACAASHIHFIDDSSEMQQLALAYYCSGLQELSRLMANTTRIEQHDGVLMSVMMLYLHGVSLSNLRPIFLTI